MKYVKIESSSNVDAIGYDEQTQTLEVRYLGKGGIGPLYRYEQVPAVLHMQLMAAHSKGQYLAQHVKKNPNFKCTLITESAQAQGDIRNTADINQSDRKYISQQQRNIGIISEEKLKNVKRSE